MYTQFFGNFLLRQGVVTTTQLIDALKKQSSAHFKLGTLAIHAGFMTANEVENVIILQTHKDQLFGELAISEGYLTPEQVKELLHAQNPDYLLLGQVLIEDGILTHAEFENLITDYQSENEIDDLVEHDEQKEYVSKLVNHFCQFENVLYADKSIEFLVLLFNNLVRFIGEDFTPLNVAPFNEYLTNRCISQTVNGEFTLNIAIDMDESTAISFASRYVGDNFTAFDEYVQASLEDFLNLHNGLFTVNLSNEAAVELTLSPPESHINSVISPPGVTYLIPVIYTFGTINFLITLLHE